MADVVGVRFRPAGKVYYFDPASIELAVDDRVVVETTRGLELGWVATAPVQVPDSELTEPLKPVVRKAAPEDSEREQQRGEEEREALAVCAELVDKFNLPMKLLSAESNFDGSRISILFSAAERVDFRALVRELMGRLKKRVELRQVGPRDEAKLVGGYGRCGRPLCCVSFLCEFAPVSIRMAKDQNLPLNPMKISGACGRLLCCLVYENAQYKDMIARMPREGQEVSTPMGTAWVTATNPIKETVMVKLESEALVELPLDRITVTGEAPPRQRGKKSSRKPPTSA
jgi:cell fate regulator YaaT (PSP1 superfamily)